MGTTQPSRRAKAAFWVPTLPAVLGSDLHHTAHRQTFSKFVTADMPLKGIARRSSEKKVTACYLFVFPSLWVFLIAEQNWLSPSSKPRNFSQPTPPMLGGRSLFLARRLSTSAIKPQRPFCG